MAHRIFTPLEVEQMVRVLMQNGMGPAAIRRRLSEQGIHWSYQHVGQGRRERVRRLRQQGLDLCRCGGTKAIGVSICPVCLDKKWGHSTDGSI